MRYSNGMRSPIPNTEFATSPHRRRLSLRLPPLCAILLAAVTGGAAEINWENVKRGEWPVSPGVTMVALEVPEIPCQIRMVKFDLRNTALRFGVRQGRDALFTTASVGDMGNAIAETQKLYPIAGLNADFFNNSWRSPTYGNPVGLTISDFRVFTTGTRPTAEYRSLYQTADGKFHTGTLKFTGTVEAGERSFPVESLNALHERPRALRPGEPPRTALFTARWTGALPSDGLRLRFDTPPEATRRAVRTGRITGKIRAGQKLSGDPRDGAILGLTPADATGLGDLTGPVKISIGFDGAPGTIRNAVRIWTIPLENGKIRPTHEVANYPRSLFGLGPDRFVFFVADGRQPGWSKSLPSQDAARILAREGCDFAGQFDGGGSATLWVRGRYVNRPSGGRPRKVANAIFFSSCVPLPAGTGETAFPGSAHGMLWGF